MKIGVVFALLIAACGAPARADVAATDVADIAGSWVRQYCVDCHGADERKAGLRLDELNTNLTEPSNLAAWVRVFDKVVAGEMPPKDAAQPSEAARRQFTEELRNRLHSTSMNLQRTLGRVPVRRLNAAEYENTVRELAGTQVRVKELLPEENSVAGFDNVGSALDISATHLLRYQEAAERAILSAVPQYPPIPLHERRTGIDFAERGPNFRQLLGTRCKLDGESAVLYSKMPRYGLCMTNHVSAAGTYRIRFSAAAIGDDKRPIPAGLFVLEGYGRDEPVLFDCRDIPHGDSQVVELELELGRRQAFVVNLLTNWDIREFKRPIEEYGGPGLRIDWIEIEGPIGEFPPRSYRRLFGDLPLEARSVTKAKQDGKRVPDVRNRRIVEHWQNDPLEPTSSDRRRDAERLVRAFLPRAFRGPVPKPTADDYVARVHRKLDEGYSFFDAMTYGYKAILSSPHFLLFTEPGVSEVAADGRFESTRLDGYAIANRLAYFLWTGPPDEVLLDLASRGRLSEPSVLRAEVDRLLADPRSRRFTESFCGQWLDLRKINATIPDPQLYGDFDGLLLWAMPQESHLVFEDILRHDRSLVEFVDSDWSIVNKRLADHYGIAGVEGNHFRKVMLPANCRRGGVLTQAAVLKVTADGTRTSPVLRGKWVLEKIVGRPPSPPPPDVPAIEPDIRGATTIREQLEKHRDNSSCAACHVHIDPPGFALESFDPIGGYREFYRATSGSRDKILPISFQRRPLFRGPDVEPSGTTFEGSSFADAVEYKKLLVADPDQLARNLVEKMLVYSTGGELQFADREVVEQITQTLRSRNYGFRTLIHEVVQSRVFLNK